jgi:predicted small secreted protein
MVVTSRIALAAAATALITLGACNTVNGAGKDMRSAGSAVSDASGKSKK